MLHSRPSASIFLPPFPRAGFASRPSRRARHRYYEGSNSCPPHSGRQVSPLTSPCLPGISTPTTRSARWPLCPSHQRHRLLPGFARHEQARHEITPKQVRYPTDCQFASRCSPPRLAATQLRSASELRPAPARTSTVPTKRPRGAHSCPRTRASMAANAGIHGGERRNWRSGARARAKTLDPRFRGDDRRDASSVSGPPPWQPTSACGGPIWMKMVAARTPAPARLFSWQLRGIEKGAGTP